jgi:hypothetical protein
MIKRSLKRLASVFLVLAVVACAGAQVDTGAYEAYKQEVMAGEVLGDLLIENRSDCLLAAVTIVEMVHPQSGVHVMELVFDKWYKPGEKDIIKLIIGREYGMMVEGFYFDKKTGKATAMVGQQYKSGVMQDDKSNEIIIHCIHTNPRPA